MASDDFMIAAIPRHESHSKLLSISRDRHHDRPPCQPANVLGACDKNGVQKQFDDESKQSNCAKLVGGLIF